MNKRIVLVEDEAAIAENVVYALKNEGLRVDWYELGEQSLAHLHSQPADLVILDVGLPDISGFELCKKIRQFSDVPIIFLTARSDEIDRVVGLEIGGDDYVVKPFSPRELVARVKVILRRNVTAVVEQPSKQIQCTAFTIDLPKRKICYHSTPLELTAYEFGILQVLLGQPERVFTREQLMDAVWPSSQESFDRSVDTHIKLLRAKLKLIDEAEQPLVTHRGVGYSIKKL
jgi:two-component system catabolic regulation response regulator CreB